MEELGDQYCLLGPYKETSVRTEVELSEFSADSPLTATINNLRSEGWKVSSCLFDISYLVSQGFVFYNLAVALSHSCKKVLYISINLLLTLLP